jgi:hypothetical protein
MANWHKSGLPAGNPICENGLTPHTTMNEVTAICIAVGALFAGLWLLGWAFGDFNRPPQAPR